MKKQILLLVLSLAFMFSYAQQTEIDRLSQQAETYREQQEFEKSTACYERIIAMMEADGSTSLIPSERVHLEEAQARKETKVDSFVEFCKGKDSSPKYCEEAIKNARSRITPKEPVEQVESNSEGVTTNSDDKEPAAKHNEKETDKKREGFFQKLWDFFFGGCCKN